MDLNVVGTNKIKYIEKYLGDKPIRSSSAFRESISEKAIQPRIVIDILKPNTVLVLIAFTPGLSCCFKTTIFWTIYYCCHPNKSGPRNYLFIAGQLTTNTYMIPSPLICRPVSFPDFCGEWV